MPLRLLLGFITIFLVIFGLPLLVFYQLGYPIWIHAYLSYICMLVIAVLLSVWLNWCFKLK